MTTYSLITGRRELQPPRFVADGGAATPARMRLMPSGDGWSLLAPDGRLVFSALGIRGRKRCLEFAHARGALALSS